MLAGASAAASLFPLSSQCSLKLSLIWPKKRFLNPQNEGWGDGEHSRTQECTEPPLCCVYIYIYWVFNITTSQISQQHRNVMLRKSSLCVSKVNSVLYQRDNIKSCRFLLRKVSRNTLTGSVRSCETFPAQFHRIPPEASIVVMKWCVPILHWKSPWRAVSNS